MRLDISNLAGRPAIASKIFYIFFKNLLTDRPAYAIIETQKGKENPTNQKGATMYEDFEMDELEALEMTDETLEEMAAWYETQKEEWVREEWDE